MKGHVEILQILASYRDASAEQQRVADAHVRACADCAAKAAEYGKVEAALRDLAAPELPARLRQPLSTVLWGRDMRPASHAPLGIRFGGALAPAAVVIVLLIAVSAIMMSVNAGRAPVTTTPTLTTTLTPTTIVARQTEPALFVGVGRAAVVGLSYVPVLEPTPAPAPAPAPLAGAALRAARSPVLFAGYAAHATMTH